MTTSEAYALLKKIAEAGDCTVSFGYNEEGPAIQVLWRPDLPAKKRDDLIEIAILASQEFLKIEEARKAVAEKAKGKVWG